MDNVIGDPLFQTLRGYIHLNVAEGSHGNAPCLFGNYQGQAIRFLRDTDRRPVARAKTASYTRANG